jgi:hypothetical protein
MTKRQITLLAAIAVFVVLAAVRLSAQQNATACNARYALVQGEYLFVSSKGTTLSEHGLFRIDTTTGQTWRFVFREAETYWDPIDVMQQKNPR